MQKDTELRELDARSFAAELAAILTVYEAAMEPPASQLLGRRSIMERHAGNPAFRAVAATAVPASATAPVSRGPGASTGGRVMAAATASRVPGGAAGEIIAFAYGFHGTRGQWWHDLVGSALTATAGTESAAAWLADSFEIAEVHVRPDHQHHGIGKRLLFGLTAGRSERTAVLSTMDADSPARRLYRGVGFTDLLTGFSFPGSYPPYAVMGAELPLRDARA